ncbi:DUF6207 family protein [Streptomyces coeruleorubidus]|uniref:DUF6207 family protein n=1 Tax=Streptomyces coeruleorubidus TaxID=116188 RepID=UPI003828DC06
MKPFAGPPRSAPTRVTTHSRSGRAGLAAVVAAADDESALAFQQLLADRWATAPGEQLTRDSGQPGVRLRRFLDLRQPLDS